MCSLLCTQKNQIGKCRKSQTANLEYYHNYGINNFNVNWLTIKIEEITAKWLLHGTFIFIFWSYHFLGTPVFFHGILQSYFFWVDQYHVFWQDLVFGISSITHRRLILRWFRNFLWILINYEIRASNLVAPSIQDVF